MTRWKAWFVLPLTACMLVLAADSAGATISLCVDADDDEPDTVCVTVNVPPEVIVNLPSDLDSLVGG